MIIGDYGYVEHRYDFDENEFSFRVKIKITVDTRTLNIVHVMWMGLYKVDTICEPRHSHRNSIDSDEYSLQLLHC